MIVRYDWFEERKQYEISSGSIKGKLNYGTGEIVWQLRTFAVIVRNLRFVPSTYITQLTPLPLAQ